MIRVPLAVRYRLRALADADQQTYGQLINHGLDLIEQEKFWDKVAALRPDQSYREELTNWDSADLGSTDAA